MTEHLGFDLRRLNQSAHTCPVCLQRVIFRSEVRTCGAPDCLHKWRMMSDFERDHFLKLAAEIDREYKVEYWIAKRDHILILMKKKGK